MPWLWLLLAMQVLIPDEPCTADFCFRAVFRQIKKDTVVVLNYPAGAKPTHVCTDLFDKASATEIGRKCWTPKDDRFEIDVWEGLLYRGVYFEVELWRDGGGYVVISPLNDEVYERGNQHRDPSNDCGGDDCP